MDLGVGVGSSPGMQRVVGGEGRKIVGTAWQDVSCPRTFGCPPMLPLIAAGMLAWGISAARCALLALVVVGLWVVGHKAVGREIGALGAVRSRTS